MGILKNKSFIWIAIIFFGLLFRFIFLPSPGFEADISFWKSWGLGVYDHGLTWALHNTNSNYPAPFMYVLGMIVKVYSLLADPHNFNQFWTNTNAIFLTVSKLPSVIADFVIFGIILWIGKHAKRLGFPPIPYPLYPLLAALYLLSPIPVIDGALWGQVDSVGVLIFLLAIVAAVTKRPMLAGFIYIASVMTKLQNMIYGPIFFLFLWESLGYEGLIKAGLGSVIGFFGLNIESFLARDMGRVIESLVGNYDYFPWMSLNAFNPWWIISRAHGMQMSDKVLSIGILNAKSVGLFIFSSFYLFAILRLLLHPKEPASLLNGYIVRKQKTIQQYNNTTIEDESRRQNILRKLIEGLIIINASFFLFQTQSHDRYAFPLSVFLLLWAPFFINPQPTTNNQQFKKFTIFYLLFTIFYFYNLHTALVFNYPNNGLPILSSLTQPFLTITTSLVQVALFMLFLFYVIKKSPRFTYIIPALVLLLLLVKGNLPLISKQPIPLTKFVPYISEQGFGTRVTDMPVNSGFSIKQWTFLSDQYAFYRKGIGTHANSRMDFDIGRHFTKFTTDYGIDTEAGEKGTAMFEIYGDGKKLFASTKIGRFDLPRHAEVNLTGVKILGLVTTDAGDGATDDHTDWLRPTLWP